MWQSILSICILIIWYVIVTTAALISCITTLQVANFEYIDEAKALAEKEEARRKAAEAAKSANYWDELLKDKYDVQKVEEHTAMGKGKRSRKQVSPHL